MERRNTKKERRSEKWDERSLDGAQGGWRLVPGSGTPKPTRSEEGRRGTEVGAKD